MRNLKIVKSDAPLTDEEYDKIMMLRSKRAKYTGEMIKDLPKCFKEELDMLEDCISEYFRSNVSLEEVEFDYDPDNIVFIPKPKVHTGCGHTYGFKI